MRIRQEEQEDAISDIDFLHEVGSRIASTDPLHVVLERIIELVSDTMGCDSCFLYVLDRNQLVLRASKNPHSNLIDKVAIPLGKGITGWVAAHKQHVAIPADAPKDPRFERFGNLPEDSYEAFLSVPILCRGKLVGVINMQHRDPHHHSQHQIRLVTLLGYLVGAEVELARMEEEKLQLANQLETRKLMERAKGILQKELGVDEEAAYLALQKQSRQRRKSIREIAEAIILMEDMRRGKK